MTQSQIHELLESEHARTFVEGAEERGYVEPAEIEAFALEHDLGEEDAEQFQRELEAIGLEIRQPVEEAEAKAEKPEEKAAEAQPQVLVGSADSLQLFDVTGQQRPRGMGPERHSDDEQRHDRAQVQLLRHAACDNGRCDHHRSSQQYLIDVRTLFLCASAKESIEGKHDAVAEGDSSRAADHFGR